MVYYCTESCYYNDCGVCSKGECPRFTETQNLDEDEDTEE